MRMVRLPENLCRSEEKHGKDRLMTRHGRIDGSRSNSESAHLQMGGLLGCNSSRLDLGESILFISLDGDPLRGHNRTQSDKEPLFLERLGKRPKQIGGSSFVDVFHQLDLLRIAATADTRAGA